MLIDYLSKKEQIWVNYWIMKLSHGSQIPQEIMDIIYSQTKDSIFHIHQLSPADKNKKKMQNNVKCKIKSLMKKFPIDYHKF